MFDHADGKFRNKKLHKKVSIFWEKNKCIVMTDMSSVLT